jgi:hypothetical protein
MNIMSLLGMNPVSGIGMAGNPMSGIGMMERLGGGKDPVSAPPAGTTPGMTEDERKKKEGIAGMLSGIGKGHDKQSPGLSAPQQQQPFDIQTFLASLFGG